LTRKRHNSSSRLNLKSYQTNDDVGPVGIKEEAEDKLSDNSDTAAATNIVKTQQKRNLLCKNLFDQCKELCYN